MNSTQKMVTIAILTALATILHVVEALLPNPFPIPGVKLGLANIVALLALLRFDYKTGLQIAVLRTVLGSLLCGTFLTANFFFSFAGAVASTLCMAVLIHFSKKLSTIGISVAGAATHNLAQLCVAGFIIEQTGILFYLPMMLLVSIPTGIATGLVVKYLAKPLCGFPPFSI